MNRLYITAIDDEYFQNSVTQETIKRILTVWCANNYPQYRQGMHEVCALIFLALNQEALAWAESLLPSPISSTSVWSQYMCQHFSSKKQLLISSLTQTTNPTPVLHTLQYCLCEESDVYTIFDRVMMRGLRVVYCPEVTDGIPPSPTQEEANGSSAVNLSVGYLNLIQGILEIIHLMIC